MLDESPSDLAAPAAIRPAHDRVIPPGSARAQAFLAPDAALVAAEDLAFTMAVALRGHGHLGNVLTHVGGDWIRIERALLGLLRPQLPDGGYLLLSPLQQNLLEIFCAERGTTGKIARPFLDALLHRLLAPEAARQVLDMLDGLHLLACILHRRRRRRG